MVPWQNCLVQNRDKSSRNGPEAMVPLLYHGSLIAAGFPTSARTS